MDGIKRHQLSCMAIIGLCNVLFLAQALAGQPPRVLLQRSVTATVNQSTAGQPARALDLRLPSMMANLGKMSDSFPTLSHHALPSSEGASRMQLPSLGSAGGQHIPGRVELLAKNFRRDGLPVAKLWQNQDSLVHLGLNNKGKPGLWLIQKIH
jgi:hypothetical protein